MGNRIGFVGVGKKQYRKMEQLGLGGLDKSGISELTFKDRRPAPKTGVQVGEGQSAA